MLKFASARLKADPELLLEALDAYNFTHGGWFSFSTSAEGGVDMDMKWPAAICKFRYSMRYSKIRLGSFHPPLIRHSRALIHSSTALARHLVISGDLSH